MPSQESELSESQQLELAFEASMMDGEEAAEYLNTVHDTLRASRKDQIAQVEPVPLQMFAPSHVRTSDTEQDDVTEDDKAVHREEGKGRGDHCGRQVVLLRPAAGAGGWLGKGGYLILETRDFTRGWGTAVKSLLHPRGPPAELASGCERPLAMKFWSRV